MELTFGQKLVGLNFNPSGDEKVTKAKQLCADLADMVREHKIQKQATADDQEIAAAVYEHAIDEILNAQMNAVKYLTLK